MFWNWIRDKAKTAVLAGLADAVQEMDGPDTQDPQEAIAFLRSRVQPALPAPEAQDRPLRRKSEKNP